MSFVLIVICLNCFVALFPSFGLETYIIAGSLWGVIIVYFRSKNFWKKEYATSQSIVILHLHVLKKLCPPSFGWHHQNHVRLKFFKFISNNFYCSLFKKLQMIKNLFIYPYLITLIVTSAIEKHSFRLHVYSRHVVLVHRFQRYKKFSVQNALSHAEYWYFFLLISNSFAVARIQVIITPLSQQNLPVQYLWERGELLGIMFFLLMTKLIPVWIFGHYNLWVPVIKKTGVHPKATGFYVDYSWLFLKIETK